MVKVFFRIDDFYSPSISMKLTIDQLLNHGFCVHIAVIPAKLNVLGEKYLLELKQKFPERIEIGQHGLYHKELKIGKKRFEVGPGMSVSRQKEIIAQGWKLLTSKLGDTVSPIFVPPFNGYDSGTIEALEQLSFKIISAEDRCCDIKMEKRSIRNISINFDVIKKYYPQAETKSIKMMEIEIRKKLLTTDFLGIMLHPDLHCFSSDWLTQLIEIIDKQGQYVPLSIIDFAEFGDADLYYAENEG